MKSVDGQPAPARADTGARTGCRWAVRSRVRRQSAQSARHPV